MKEPDRLMSISGSVVEFNSCSLCSSSECEVSSSGNGREIEREGSVLGNGDGLPVKDGRDDVEDDGDVDGT